MRNHTAYQPLTILAIFMLISVAPLILDAQERYIEVTGSATVSAKPEFVQLTATLSGSGETAEDAIKKISIVLEEFSQAINPMDFDNVTVEYSGTTFPSSTSNMNQVVFMGDGEMATDDPEMTASKTVTINIALDAEDSEIPVETISKVVDVAKQAKAKFGETGRNSIYSQMTSAGQGLMEFKVKDTKSLEKQALQQAMEDARAKAEELADLANTKIVRVTSINTDSKSEILSMQEQFQIQLGSGVKKNDQQNVQVTKTLRVRFEIAN